MDSKRGEGERGGRDKYKMSLRVYLKDFFGDPTSFCISRFKSSMKGVTANQVQFLVHESRFVASEEHVKIHSNDLSREDFIRWSMPREGFLVISCGIV